MHLSLLLWGGFLLIVFALLALDLGVFHRKPHAIGVREALGWTGFWILIALVFNASIYVVYDQGWRPGGGPEQLSGSEAAVRFFTAYLIEKMLSLDNIFVIAAIMAAFRVPAQAQHRVLYWGILGALVMRGAMILVGTAAVREFSWLVYLLGGLLLVTGVKMFRPEPDSGSVEEPAIVRGVRRVLPVAQGLHDGRLVVTENGHRMVTTTFLALVAVEATDVLFAIDSVPAVLAISLDPFIVFTSNVFAILGLRSLYFALGSMLSRFHLLRPTLSVILVFVGLKMIVAHHYPIPPLVSLAVIGTLLLAGVVLSIIQESRKQSVMSTSKEESVGSAQSITKSASPPPNVTPAGEPEQPMASPFGPLMWIAVPFVLVIIYALVFPS